MNQEPLSPEALLPHRGPSLLLCGILDVSEEHCLARVRVAPGAWYLDERGEAPAWIALEWMAQAASAFSGYRHRQAGRAPRVGFMLGTRRFETMVPAFPAGGEFEVEARLIFLDEAGPSAFSCQVRDGAETLARATLKAIEVP
jgi:predicted hotdog family 3-hydroxylacyl-ACP dehydratase